jgi:hypothetical protein
VAVVNLDGSAASLAVLDRFADELAGDRLDGIPFSALAG